MAIHVGIVAEGKSEWFVLEEVMRQLHPDIEFQRIRPDVVVGGGSPYGWRGVKAWCEENGQVLETLMSGVTSRPLNLIVIHADCSMAHNVSALRPCPPASDTATALQAVIVEQWLQRTPQPQFVVVTNPSRCTEAWVVASLEPPYRNIANIECDDAVANELVGRGHLRQKDGEVKKPEARYRPLAALVGGRLALVRARCTQAEYFCQAFGAAVAAVASLE